MEEIPIMATANTQTWRKVCTRDHPLPFLRSETIQFSGWSMILKHAQMLCLANVNSGLMKPGLLLRSVQKINMCY